MLCVCARVNWWNCSSWNQITHTHTVELCLQRVNLKVKVHSTKRHELRACSVCWPVRVLDTWSSVCAAVCNVHQSSFFCWWIQKQAILFAKLVLYYLVCGISKGISKSNIAIFGLLLTPNVTHRVVYLGTQITCKFMLNQSLPNVGTWEWIWAFFLSLGQRWIFYEVRNLSMKPLGRVKYWQQVPLGTSTEFQVLVQMSTAPNPSNQ